VQQPSKPLHGLQPQQLPRHVAVSACRGSHQPRARLSWPDTGCC
jgi:hypothetical protein